LLGGEEEGNCLPSVWDSKSFALFLSSSAVRKSQRCTAPVRGEILSLSVSAVKTKHRRDPSAIIFQL
jgi:hypothetical protein